MCDKQCKIMFIRLKQVKVSKHVNNYMYVHDVKVKRTEENSFQNSLY